jgi:hypothetical protein
MADDFFANFLNLFLACVGMECKAVLKVCWAQKWVCKLLRFTRPMQKFLNLNPKNLTLGCVGDGLCNPFGKLTSAMLSAGRDLTRSVSLSNRSSIV